MGSFSHVNSFSRNVEPHLKKDMPLSAVRKNEGIKWNLCSDPNENGCHTNCYWLRITLRQISGPLAIRLHGIVFGDNGSSLRFGLFEDCWLQTEVVRPWT